MRLLYSKTINTINALCLLMSKTVYILNCFNSNQSNTQAYQFVYSNSYPAFRMMNLKRNRLTVNLFISSAVACMTVAKYKYTFNYELPYLPMTLKEECGQYINKTKYELQWIRDLTKQRHHAE